MSDSPSENDDVTAAAATSEDPGSTGAQTTQDGHSESSPEKPAAKSMLEAVQAAVAPKEASPTSEQDRTEPETAPGPKDTTSEEDELSADELKQLGPKTQRRIKRFERKLAAKDTEINGLKSKADEYDKIETFVRNSGLTNEVVGATLQIAALMRSNPREALTRLAPIVGQLQQIVGETLPPELAARVKQGYLTEEDARALSRSNAEAALAKRRADELTTRTTVENTRRQQQEAADRTVGSVETWEANKAKSDPDWNLKRDEVAEQVELAIERENRTRLAQNPNAQPWFPSPDEAIKLSEDALKRVEDRLKRFTPKPRAIDPVQPGAPSNRNVAAPKSMLDVVRQTVGAT